MVTRTQKKANEKTKEKNQREKKKKKVVEGKQTQWLSIITYLMKSFPFQLSDYLLESFYICMLCHWIYVSNLCITLTYKPRVHHRKTLQLDRYQVKKQWLPCDITRPLSICAALLIAVDFKRAIDVSTFFTSFVCAFLCFFVIILWCNKISHWYRRTQKRGKVTRMNFRRNISDCDEMHLVGFSAIVNQWNFMWLWKQEKSVQITLSHPHFLTNWI